MTRKRYDGHSTEFGLWLREEPSIASDNGFTTTNLDFIWRNYRTGRWMLIEEKRRMGRMTKTQSQTFRILHEAAKSDPNYQGFAFIQFQATSPDDGAIFLNYDQIDRAELVQRLHEVRASLDFPLEYPTR